MDEACRDSQGRQLNAPCSLRREANQAALEAEISKKPTRGCWEVHDPRCALLNKAGDCSCVPAILKAGDRIVDTGRGTLGVESAAQWMLSREEWLAEREARVGQIEKLTAIVESLQNARNVQHDALVGVEKRVHALESARWFR